MNLRSAADVTRVCGDYNLRVSVRPPTSQLPIADFQLPIGCCWDVILNPNVSIMSALKTRDVIRLTRRRVFSTRSHATQSLFQRDFASDSESNRLQRPRPVENDCAKGEGSGDTLKK